MNRKRLKILFGVLPLTCIPACGLDAVLLDHATVDLRVMDLDAAAPATGVSVTFAAVRSIEDADLEETLQSCGDDAGLTNGDGDFTVGVRLQWPTLFAPTEPRVLQPFWIVRIESDGRSETLVLNLFDNGTAEGNLQGLPRLRPVSATGEEFSITIESSHRSDSGTGDVPDDLPGATSCGG